MVRRPLSLLALVGALALPVPSDAAPTGVTKAKIKKCQDATGRWHYGDTAARECARSKVTLMNERGLKRDEIAAPLTEAELKKQKKSQTAEEKANEQAKRDQILLSTYAHEADIIYVRDRKLAQLENSIKASQETVESLRAALARQETQAALEEKAGGVSERTAKAVSRTRAQVERHETAIAQKRQEQETLKAQAQADLERYRELKGEQPGSATPKAR